MRTASRYVRGAPSIADPVAGRGRVDDHQVVGRVLLAAALELGHLPRLADRDELARARGGGGEVVEDPVGEEQRRRAAASRADPARYSSSASCGSIETAWSGPSICVSRGPTGAAAEGAGDPLLLADLADDRRACPRARAASAERGGDRGLPDAAFAGHEDESLVESRGTGGRILPNRTNTHPDGDSRPHARDR